MKKISKGFTLIELLVVIAIIGLLSSVIIAPIQSSRKKARDARRISDMKQMETALEFYYDEYGQYPDSDGAGCGGWDTPGNGTFITPLVSGGFLPANMKDPNVDDSCGNYRYYHYPANYTGCTRSFYVLGVVDMDTSGNPYPTSPGWYCPTRNWQGEMEWVMGKYD